MWRILLRLGVLIVEGMGITWAIDNILLPENPDPYPQETVETITQEQFIERFATSLFESKEGFNPSDFDRTFSGRYSKNSIAIKFSNAYQSINKDTIFFAYRLPLLNQSGALSLQSGNGFTVWNERTIKLINNKTKEELEGEAYKIINDQTEQQYIYILFEASNGEMEFFNIRN